MYSTPKLTGVLFVAAVALLAAGCNTVPMQKAADKWDTTRRDFNAKVRPSQERIETVMVDPPADQATQLRGWDASTFLYPNGATLAYPTYSLNNEDRPKWLKDDHVYSLAASGILVYDIITMPVYMVMEPPTTAVTFHGVRMPATMTLAPALPPEAPAKAEQPLPAPAPVPQPESQQPTPPAQPNTPVVPEPPTEKPAEPAPSTPGAQ